MPTITLNKKVFEKLVGKELRLEELKDRISMLGTDLEKIDDDEIHVEIFPNRPDLLSEQGFARAFSSFIGVKTGLKDYKIIPSGEKVIIEGSVNKVRPYTACALIKNINLDDEKIKQIIQIQEKLHITYGRNRKKCAIGIYPLEKISFPITYLADEPKRIKFRPLESESEMNGLQIIEEHPVGKEYANLLKDKEKFPYFIDSNNEILSMPPIINSYNTGRVTTDTKDLFVECSGFNFKTLSKCLNMLVTALADMGGDIQSLELEYKKDLNDGKTSTKLTPNLEPEQIELDLDYINKRLGIKLTDSEAIKLLAKMGFGYNQNLKKILIPSYRSDILHQIDLVEDIAIAYGYENFKETIPNVSTIGEETKFEKFANKIREIMVGKQFIEVKNYHLSTSNDLVLKMGLEQETISLQNALGEHNNLRDSLIPCLMKTLTKNQHHEYPQNIFEIGKVFSKDTKTETGIVEAQHLAITLCHEKTDFTEIHQALDIISSQIGLELNIKETEHKSYIWGRVGNIILNDEKIGIIGELHPQVLDNWNLVMPVCCLEINLKKLLI